MKVSFLKTATSAALICFSLIFASCASIPEPSKKNSNLLYGNVSFNFTCIPNNYGIPESSEKSNGIEVKFKNVKTNKTITMTTNNKGEFYRTNVPEGTYVFKSLKAKVNYGGGYEAEYIADFCKTPKESYFYFVSLGNVVMNLGKINLDISITDINYYSYYIRWDEDFDETYYNFCMEHPDSDWINKDWYTRKETTE